MGREIKFRVWTGENLYLLESTDEAHNHYLQTGSGGFWLYHSVDGKLIADSKSGGVLMEFVNLKDKNKKEMYEDDIVRILYTDWPSKSDSDTRTIQQYMNDLAYIGKITYHEDRYTVAIPSKKYPGEFHYSSIFPGQHGFIEVIGNIWENPELMPRSVE